MAKKRYTDDQLLGSAPKPQGILDKTLSAGLSGLSAVGNLLDLPGSMARDTIAGVATGNFSKHNPFDQLLTPLRDDNRTTGRDLNRMAGLAGRKDTYGNWWGGLGTDIATDPLTYLTLGGAAIGKGAGTLMSKAGIKGLEAASIATRAAQGGKLAAKGAWVGPREARLMLTPGHVKEFAPEAFERLMSVYKANPGSVMKMDEPMGALAKIWPLGDAGLIGTGKGAQSIARGLDVAGDFVRHAKIPGTTIRPIGDIANMLNAKSYGATSARKMQIGGERFASKGKAIYEVNTFAAKIAHDMIEAGHKNTDAGKMMSWFEMPHTAPPEMQPIVQEMRSFLDQMPQAAQKLGVKIDDVGVRMNLMGSVAGYFPRQATEGLVDRGGVGAKSFAPFAEATVARAPWTHGAREGTKTLSDIAKDPAMEALLGANDLKGAEQLLQSKYGSELNPLYFTDKQYRGLKAKGILPDPFTVKQMVLGGQLDRSFAPKNAYRAAVNTLSKMSPELRKVGIYSNHPITDFAAMTSHTMDKLHASKIALDYLSELGSVASDGKFLAYQAPGSVSVYDILKGSKPGQGLNLELGGRSGGAIKYITDKLRAAGVSAPDLSALSHGGSRKAAVKWAKSHFIDQDSAKFLTQMVEGVRGPESLQPMMKLYDDIANFTKMMFTNADPRFHVRNVYSGLASNALADQVTWDSVTNAHTLLQGKPIKDLRLNPFIVEEWNRRQAAQAAGGNVGPSLQFSKLGRQADFLPDHQIKMGLDRIDTHGHALPETDVKWADLSGSLPDELVQEITSDPVVGKVADAMSSGFHKMAQAASVFNDPAFGKAKFAGLVNSHGDFFGVRYGTAQHGSEGRIFIDFHSIVRRTQEMMDKLSLPPEQWPEMVGKEHAGVLMHELAHQVSHTEGEGHARAMTFLTGSVTKEMQDTIEGIAKALREGGDNTRATITKQAERIRQEIYGSYFGKRRPDLGVPSSGGRPPVRPRTGGSGNYPAPPAVPGTAPPAVPPANGAGGAGGVAPPGPVNLPPGYSGPPIMQPPNLGGNGPNPWTNIPPSGPINQPPPLRRPYPPSAPPLPPGFAPRPAPPQAPPAPPSPAPPAPPPAGAAPAPPNVPPAPPTPPPTPTPPAPTPPAKQLTDEEATKILAEMLYGYEATGSYGVSSSPHAIGHTGTRLSDLLHGIPGEEPFSFKRVLSKAMGGQGTSWKNPLAIRGVGQNTETKFSPVAAGEDMSFYVEGLNRIAPMLALMGQGVHPREAIDRVLQAQVAYQPRFYTKFEKDVLKRIFLFYSFSKGQIPFTMKQLIEKPGGRLAQLLRGINTSRDQDELVPQHVAETASIPWADKPDGTKSYITGFGLGFEDPMQFATPSLRSAGLEALSRSNPLLKGALEHVTGQSFFQRGPGGGGRELTDLDPPLGRTLANIGELTGLRNKKSPIRYPGSDVIEHVLANTPASNLLVKARTLTDPRKGVGAKLSNTLTGLKITDVSPATQDRELRARISQVEKKLGASTYLDTFVPADVKAEMSPEEAQAYQQLQALRRLLEERSKARKK